MKLKIKILRMALKRGIFTLQDAIYFKKSEIIYLYKNNLINLTKADYRKIVLN
jgi:hypothetical protein